MLSRSELIDHIYAQDFESRLQHVSRCSPCPDPQGDHADLDHETVRGLGYRINERRTLMPARQGSAE